MTVVIVYIVIGILSGIIMGFFGLAGGIVVVPGLMFLAGFSQKMASGTNLLILVVPVSLMAALEYYRAGNTSIKAAIIIAAAMSVSAWFSSHMAIKINSPYLRLSFGLFVMIMGIYISATAFSKLPK
jgi:uncharacterized membrane protein YfcA